LDVEFSSDVPESEVHYIMDRIVDAVHERVTKGSGLVSDNVDYYTTNVSISNNIFGSSIQQNFN
jgi:hypothetical protein